ncbi:MAG: hypothetical protein K6F70_08085 [Eggerthellaceae bacterium]|nr:hypothetical protein [Eggerthellaceae bacterium]
MSYSIIERRVEDAVQNLVGDKALRVVNGVERIAAKQGGETSIDNYRLLGKRALIVAGAVAIVVPVAVATVAITVSRKAEERRIERVVRRVLEEERQQAESETE